MQGPRGRRWRRRKQREHGYYPSSWMTPSQQAVRMPSPSPQQTVRMPTPPQRAVRMPPLSPPPQRPVRMPPPPQQTVRMLPPPQRGVRMPPPPPPPQQPVRMLPPQQMARMPSTSPPQQTVRMPMPPPQQTVSMSPPPRAPPLSLQQTLRMSPPSPPQWAVRMPPPPPPPQRAVHMPPPLPPLSPQTVPMPPSPPQSFFIKPIPCTSKLDRSTVARLSASVRPQTLPPPADATKCATGTKLLAGYLAHEFLTYGTLQGKPMLPPPLIHKEKEPVAPESSKGYLEVSRLLMEGGARIPGIVNPSQLGDWLGIKK